MEEDYSTGDMLDTYLYESRQLLEHLQEMMLKYKDDECFDEEGINEIFRTMHTLKGSAGTMMFDEISAVAHKLEDIFYYIREYHPDGVLHLELIEHVLAVEDFIEGEMDKLLEGGTADGNAKDLIESLDRFLSGMKAASGEAQAEVSENNQDAPKQFYIAPMVTIDGSFYKVYITYYPEILMANMHAFKAVRALKKFAEDMIYYPDDILTNENSSKDIIENGFTILLQTQAKEEDIRKAIQISYDIKQVDISRCSLKEYRQGFKSDALETHNEPAPGDFVIASEDKERGGDKPKKSAFISVDVSKMDILMELIEELAVSQSVVLRNPDLEVPGLALNNFHKAGNKMEQISKDLRNVITSMSMVPLTATFQKMNRTVFEVSRKLGKEVDFETFGEYTEVDKNVIEHISDPLMHLVRNAVDHGIETKEERVAKGKTPKGKITLFASTESGMMCIRVEDNGRGLDRENILAKAKKQGLLEEGRTESSYSDQEVYRFITLPGFSTKEQVTEYSGRGVGMDVVIENLRAIGGSLEIDSIPGEGSQMSLKIPLKLNSMDGAVLQVGNSYFVVDTGNIRSCACVTAKDVSQKPDGTEYVKIQNETYPVFRLGNWYHIKECETEIDKGMMVAIEAGKEKVCLFVDRFLGEQQIMVRPVPEYVRTVMRLSGCTQLGDGSTALILDTSGMGR